jgi:hypothetical protein
MNIFSISILVALFLGVINGYYWSKQGYRGWHIYFMGTIAFFGLILLFLKFLGFQK